LLISRFSGIVPTVFCQITAVTEEVDDIVPVNMMPFPNTTVVSPLIDTVGKTENKINRYAIFTASKVSDKIWDMPKMWQNVKLQLKKSKQFCRILITNALNKVIITN
jgi:hypothetical protein